MTEHAPRAIKAADLLQAYGLASLQQLARERGIDAKGKSKSALVPLLAKNLYDPASIQRSLRGLEPNERAVLDRLILQGGEALTVRLRQQLEVEGKIDPRIASRWGGYERYRASTRRPGSTHFEDIIARLGAFGLVFTAGTGARGKNVEFTEPAQYLFIPDAVLAHLPPVLLALERAAPPAVEKAANLDALHRDLYVLLSFARDEPISLISRGQIPKRTLVRIDESFRLREGAARVRSESDLSRLPLLRALAEDLGLLVSGAGSLRPGDEVTRFLSRRRGERARQLYKAYCKSTRWSELARIPNVSITPKGNLGSSGIAAARQRVLVEIAELPMGQWIPVKHLIERLRLRAYEFLLPRGPQQSYYYYSSYGEHNPYYGANPLGLTFRGEKYEDVTWETVEAAFIRVVATEALHWLGIVDLGTSEESEEATVFRITAEGATLLQGGTPPSPAPEPNVVVQPNFQIFAFDPTGEDVLFTLDRLAERVRAEQVVEYRLTRESIYAAQRGGMDTPDILEFLEHIATTPIPQNVRRSLEEWGAQLERIVVRRGVSLVDAVDEQTLDALYAEPELSKLLGRRITPTAALIPWDRLGELQVRLVECGWACGLPLPALSEGNDALPRPALIVDPEGCISFQQPLPSMYLLRVLRPFADHTSERTMRLTPDSLRRGARAGVTAEDMIATLERFHIGPLLEDVKALVRRWAKDWGRGALVDVTLLQVDIPEIMADLLADPEITRYLRPLPGAPTLATVPRDRVDEVRAFLQARGMELRDQL